MIRVLRNVRWLLLLLCWPLTADAAGQHTMRIGGYSEALFDANHLDVEITTRLLFQDLLERINETADIHVYDTPQEVYEAFNKGELDAAFCVPTECEPLLDLSYDSLFFSTTAGGSAFERYILLTAKSRDETSVSAQALPNGRLAIPSYHRLGRKLIEKELAAAGHAELETMFSEITIPASSQSAIIDLFFGKVDAAIVTDRELGLAIDLNPQIRDSVQPVLSSKPVIPRFLVVSRQLARERADGLTRMIESMMLEPEQFSKSEQLLKLFGADSVMRLDPSDVRATMLYAR